MSLNKLKCSELTNERKNERKSERTNESWRERERGRGARMRSGCPLKEVKLVTRMRNLRAQEVVTHRRWGLRINTRACISTSYSKRVTRVLFLAASCRWIHKIGGSTWNFRLPVSQNGTDRHGTPHMFLRQKISPASAMQLEVFNYYVVLTVVLLQRASVVSSNMWKFYDLGLHLV